MSQIEAYTDAENRWHAEILYSLFKQKVTLAELQEMAAQKRSPGTVFYNPRDAEILRSLQDKGDLGALTELAERCAVLPELLEDGHSSDPDTAIMNLHALCALQGLIAEGYVERTGHGTFRTTDKAPPKSLART
jgi:hypothetical protein